MLTRDKAIFHAEFCRNKFFVSRTTCEVEIRHSGFSVHIEDNVVSFIIFSSSRILGILVANHNIIDAIIGIPLLSSRCSEINMTITLIRFWITSRIIPRTRLIWEPLCLERCSRPSGGNRFIIRSSRANIFHAQSIPILPSGGKEFFILSCEGSLGGTSDACLCAKVYCYEIALRLFNRSEFLGAGHQAKCSCNGCKENFVEVFHNASVFSSIHLTGHRHSCPLRN